jgi:DNA-binding HxlR family transcriptional regulator
MYDYEEACPVSKAASLLGERWTIQIIREMLFGASRFSELQRHLPRMSPSLLNTRLRALETAGIILRKKIPEKKGYEYLLTPAGQALQPVLVELGKWGIQQAFSEMDPNQLNVSTIVRDFSVALRVGQLPSGDTTIQFTVTGDEGALKKFVLVRNGTTQVCDENLGTEVDVYITASLATLGRIWFGELSTGLARDKALLQIVGNSFYTNNLSKWLGISQFAPLNPNRQSG